VRAAGNNALATTTTGFKQSTKQKMIQGPHTGKTYARKSGKGFRRFHRASTKGERPSPDTFKLVNSIESRRIGELKTEITANTPYADILQEKLDRPIMTEKDAKEAEIELQRSYEEALRKLI
jgi:hypothetical protein